MIEMLPPPAHGPWPAVSVTTTSTRSREAARQTMARAVTSFACFKTMVDGINSHMDAGETQLFCVGKYFDRVRVGRSKPKLVERVVRMETLRLDKGSHYPV